MNEKKKIISIHNYAYHENIRPFFFLIEWVKKKFVFNLSWIELKWMDFFSFAFNKLKIDFDFFLFFAQKSHVIDIEIKHKQILKYFEH